MSANATTAMHGQSSNVGPLGAAAVLTAVVAFGALGFVIGQGVATTTTTADRPAAGPVIDNTSMSGPRTAAQKGLVGAAIVSGVDGRFAAQYEQWVAVQEAARHGAGSPPRRTRSSIVRRSRRTADGLRGPVRDVAQGPVHGRSARTSRTCTSARIAAIGVPYSGSDFAGQYANWLKVQAATANASFPDYFQRHATADACQRNAVARTSRTTSSATRPPSRGGTGGRGVRLAAVTTRVPPAPDRNQPDTAPVPGAVSRHVRRMRQSRAMGPDDRFDDLIGSLAGFHRTWLVYLGVELGLFERLRAAGEAGLTAEGLADGQRLRRPGGRCLALGRRCP